MTPPTTHRYGPSRRPGAGHEPGRGRGRSDDGSGRPADVEHFGEVVTSGVNDMVLDTWGAVDNWIAHAPVTSYGPSGIGFVNFGTVDNFVAEGPIVTHGLGARGSNQYDGTVSNAR